MEKISTNVTHLLHSYLSAIIPRYWSGDPSMLAHYIIALFKNNNTKSGDELNKLFAEQLESFFLARTQEFLDHLFELMQSNTSEDAMIAVLRAKLQAVKPQAALNDSSNNTQASSSSTSNSGSAEQTSPRRSRKRSRSRSRSGSRSPMRYNPRDRSPDFRRNSSRDFDRPPAKRRRAESPPYPRGRPGRNDFGAAPPPGRRFSRSPPRRRENRLQRFSDDFRPGPPPVGMGMGGMHMPPGPYSVPMTGPPPPGNAIHTLYGGGVPPFVTGPPLDRERGGGFESFGVPIHGRGPRSRGDRFDRGHHNVDSSMDVDEPFGRHRGDRFEKPARDPNATTLRVTGIPDELNDPDKVFGHFRKFGEVVNMQTDVQGKQVFLKYSEHASAAKAIRAEEAVLGNRFIRIYWAADMGINPDWQPPLRPRAVPPHYPPQPSFGPPAIGMTKLENTEFLQKKKDAKETAKKQLEELKKKQQDALQQQRQLLEKLLAKSKEPNLSAKDKTDVLAQIKTLMDTMKTSLETKKKLEASAAATQATNGNPPSRADLLAKLSALQGKTEALGISPGARKGATLTSTLKLHKLPEEARNTDVLTNHLKAFGNVTSVTLQGDSALVEMDSRRSAETVRCELVPQLFLVLEKGSMLQGKKLIMSWVQPKLLASSTGSLGRAKPTPDGTQADVVAEEIYDQGGEEDYHVFEED